MASAQQHTINSDRPVVVVKASLTDEPVSDAQALNEEFGKALNFTGLPFKTQIFIIQQLLPEDLLCIKNFKGISKESAIRGGTIWETRHERDMRLDLTLAACSFYNLIGVLLKLERDLVGYVRCRVRVIMSNANKWYHKQFHSDGSTYVAYKIYMFNSIFIPDLVDQSWESSMVGIKMFITNHAMRINPTWMPHGFLIDEKFQALDAASQRAGRKV